MPDDMPDDITVIPPADEPEPERKRPGPKPKKPAEPLVLDQPLSVDAPRVRVRFLDASGPGGDKRVTLCVNGVIYSYDRNVEVDVPEMVLEAAEQAAPAEMDPATGNMRRVPRFPYQIVR